MGSRRRKFHAPVERLYQGRSPSSGGDYGLLPYRPGLLTLRH
ncbi:hypothetical protein [Dactylosporangium sp. NPDC000521]